MVCHRCGAQLDDGAPFCSACGAQQPQQPPQYTQSPCEQVAPQSDPRPRQQEYPLGWHKFLIYFSLWANGIWNLFGAVEMFTGSLYRWDGSSVASTVYSAYPVLKALDFVYGMLHIAIGVFFLCVRFQLAAFRRGAPKLLIGLYAAIIAAMVIYLMALGAIVGVDPLTANSVGSLLGGAIMLIINSVYYRNRASLFVN